MIREDFLTTQYIWVLENEHVFLAKAQHEVERGHFSRFTGYVQFYIRDVRRELDDTPSAVEWAFLFTEMWTRMGGSAPNYAWHSQDADCYHLQKRMIAESLAIKPTNSPVEDSLRQHLQDVKAVVATADALTSTNPRQLAPEPEKEEPMSNTVEIKTITYINNADVTKLSDEQLIDAIKTIENEIAALKAVKTKSTKITAKIAEAQDTLAKVVAVLDGR